jgi:hypothetical protein
MGLILSGLLGWILFSNHRESPQAPLINTDLIRKTEAVTQVSLEGHTRPLSTDADGGEQQALLREAYGKLPLSFEINKGQTDSKVKFLARGSGYSLFLTSTEAVLALSKPKYKAHKESLVEQAVRRQKRNPTQKAAEMKVAQSPGDVLRLSLISANPSARVEGADELPGKTNYFIGNDPAKWRRDVSNYSRVKYESVYPGVDMVYYGNQGQLEYDFIVAPHSDYRRIKLECKGAKSIRIDETSGELVLTTKDGSELRQSKPIIYQDIAGERRNVEGNYQLSLGREIAFRVGEYDVSQTLVIDPTLVYSTYLGGSFDDQGNAIAVGAQGNAYVTGSAESVNFPVFPNSPTQHSFQTNYGGEIDAFVTKLNAAGDGLVYSTYLGGDDFDQTYGIAVDADGNAYVTGYTDSTNFPRQNPLQTTGEAFVTKLNAAGNGLVYSTLIADVGSAIAVDGQGRAYLAGGVRLPGFKEAAIVKKLNAAGNEIMYSIQYGDGIAQAIAVDTQGNAYVAGGASGFGRFFDETSGISITKLTPTAGIAYSTRIGGNNARFSEFGESTGGGAKGIAVDTDGNAYVTGYTNTIDLPTQTAFQATYGGGIFDAVVVKLNAGGGIVYVTYLGGSGNDFASAIAIDTQRNVYIAGETDSPNFPKMNPIQADCRGCVEGKDVFVTKFNAAGNGLVYSTYFGGIDEEFGTGIAVDSKDDVYVTGYTQSPDFPTLNPFQSSYSGDGVESYDAFIIKLTDREPSNLRIDVIDIGHTMKPTLPREASTQTILLQVKDGQGNPVTDADLQIEHDAETLVEGTDTDGHNHANTNRPKGIFQQDAAPVNPDGIYKFKYTAPEVSGLIKARASCTGCTEKPFEIKVKIDGLHELVAGGSNHFKLIGDTASHPRNHFGTLQLNQALVALADSYFTKYPGSLLQYNDMSLRFGGLFDSDDEKRWRKPHATHRIGYEVDLRVQTGSAVPKEHRLGLRQLIHERNLGILIHPMGRATPPHWHLTYGQVSCKVEGRGQCTNGSVIQSVVGSGIDRAADAQTSAAGLTVHVTPTVSFNPETNLYTYTYSLRNDAASALEASSILIATGGSEVWNIKTPQGWTAAVIEGRIAVEFAATEVGQLPVDNVDDGNLVPSPFQIKPGQTLEGFSFQSPAPPSSVDFYAHGFKPIPIVDNETEAVEVASDLDDSFKGITTGPKPSNLKFDQLTYNVGEGAGRATITVTRMGDTGTAETVAYQTQDNDTFTVGCFDTTNNHNGAFARCDFATVVGTLTFAPGETSKQLTVPIIDDGYAESAETFNVVLSNSMGGPLGVTASVTITDNDVAGAPNPIITAGPATYPFFVRQQYLDFLSREPEPSEPWTAVLNRCPNIHTPPSAVTDCDRIAVSGAFFRSPENSIKGFYVFRFYKVAFNRLPQYGEIVVDMSFVSGATEAEVYARKAQLATAFAARPEFTNAYSSKTNAEYVAALLARYQLATVRTPNPADPDGATKINLSSADLLNSLNAGTLTRVQVLRAIADSDQVGAAEFNSAFVAAQYYGYLRRTPEDSGHQAWLRVINQDPNNVRIMVNGFLNSTEYRLRFGQP